MHQRKSVFADFCLDYLHFNIVTSKLLV